MPTGGDLTEVTWNHPTLGSGVIFPKAGEASNYDLGGFRSADDAQMVDGGGNMIDQISQNRWSMEVPVAWEQQDQNTLKELTDLAGSPVQADWTFTNANGTVYQGKGKPVGDLIGDGFASNIPLKVSGGGALRRL